MVRRELPLRYPVKRGRTPKKWTRTGAPAVILILGMLYLRENPLLREPLRLEHIKQRLLGHWDPVPGNPLCGHI
jgi:phosphoketolase